MVNRHYRLAPVICAAALLLGTGACGSLARQALPVLIKHLKTMQADATSG